MRRHRFHWSVYGDYARRAHAHRFAASAKFILALLDGAGKDVVLTKAEWRQHFGMWRKLKTFKARSPL